MANTRTRKTVTPLPAPAPLGLNLDELEREGTVPPLYPFVCGGVEYLMPDPYEMTPNDLHAVAAAGQDPGAILMSLLGEEAAPLADVALWKLNAAVEGWYAHYGMDVDTLRRLAGNASGSPA